MLAGGREELEKTVPYRCFVTVFVETDPSPESCGKTIKKWHSVRRTRIPEAEREREKKKLTH